MSDSYNNLWRDIYWYCWICTAARQAGEERIVTSPAPRAHMVQTVLFIANVDGMELALLKMGRVIVWQALNYVSG